MTSSQYEPASRKYEREAGVARQRLSASLDELSNRLTPGQVLDEVLTYARAGGGTFYRALTNAARENPVPSLLIGAGCMMFMSEKVGLSGYLTSGKTARGASTEGRAPEPRSSAVPGGSDDGRGPKDIAAGTLGSAVGAVKSGIEAASVFASTQASDLAEGVSAVRDAISDTSQRITRTMGETVQQYSSAIGEQISDTVEGTRRQAGTAATQVTEKFLSFTNEQPLLFAAIGLAVGAVLAAALPSTETENQIMGKSSDAIKKAAGEVASDRFGTAKAAAVTVIREAKSAAEGQGMTPAGAANVARTMGEKIVQVVTEATAAGSSEGGDKT